MNTADHSVRTYGAVGDGQTLDTAAVQRAIDACSAAGGGRVVCTPGVYLCGTLVLKSHVDLHLQAGATLLASPRRADYSAAANAPGDLGFQHERVAAEHFIVAYRAQQIAITGQGTLDGHGRAFMGPPSPKYRGFYDVPGWRPGQMITFTECRDVLLQGVRIVDSPYWTVWPHGCQNVRITGISIVNDRRTPNGDGINPDCCRNVHVSDCHFDTGDDCIALRSDGYRLGDAGRPCENITVTNCTMITPCCAVRIGYAGDGPIRHCTFSNLAITGSRTGINMLVPRVIHDQDRFRVEHGPAIHDIAFSNLVMDTQIAWYLWIGDEASPPGCIRDVRISQVTATTERACFLGGARHLPIERVRLSDIDLTVRGLTDGQLADVPDPYPCFDYWDRPGIPHAFYARHVRDLRVRGLSVRWEQRQGPWRSAVRLDQVQDVEFDGLWAAGASAEHPVLDFQRVQRATLRACRALPGSGTFLRVAGSDTRRVSLFDSDLTDAARAVERGSDVPADALHLGHHLGA